MRKLYNVDLPIPSSIQFDNYTTHIILANDNNSLDTDSQSDIDVSLIGSSSPNTPSVDSKNIIDDYVSNTNNSTTTIAPTPSSTPTSAYPGDTNNNNNSDINDKESTGSNFSQRPYSFIQSILKNQLNIGGPSVSKINYKNYNNLMGYLYNNNNSGNGSIKDNIARKLSQLDPIKAYSSQNGDISYLGNNNTANSNDRSHTERYFITCLFE